MITLFSNPRPFVGPFDLIQRNAICSWLALRSVCNVEIILFDDEENTTEAVAREFGVVCVKDVKCNENGTPLLSDVFERVHAIATQPVLAQVNADIILMRDFPQAIVQIRERLGEQPFFMIGRRWDCDVTEPMQYETTHWEQSLRTRISRQGTLHGLAGIDYWVFPNNFYFNPPAFAVGRPGMDSWLVYRARSQRVPVIDATNAITIVHQNHNYPSKKKLYYETEKANNVFLAGGLKNMLTLRDANWILTKEGLRRPPFPGRIISALSTCYAWRMLLAAKRRMVNLLCA